MDAAWLVVGIDGRSGIQSVCKSPASVASAARAPADGRIIGILGLDGGGFKGVDEFLKGESSEESDEIKKKVENSTIENGRNYDAI